MAWRTKLIRKISDSCLVTSVTFRAHVALILVHSHLLEVVGSHRAFILIGVIVELITHDWAPVTLGTLVVVIVTPWANIARLAATAV